MQRTRRTAAGAMLLSGTLMMSAGCGITDEGLKLTYTGFTPEPMGDGWAISTPEAEGLDPVVIEHVYQSLFSEELYPTAHSLLIVRHGRLVAEAYARDASERSRYHHLQSATKSITALLAGIAVDQGLIASVHTPLYEYIPEAFDDDASKRSITLFHALTMQTGLQFDNDENTSELFSGSGSSLEYVLHRELTFEPGSSFYYHDGNPQLVSGVLQEVSGMTEEAFAVRHLFGPLGITDYQWERHADGLTFGAFGLWLQPRDMAKIGWLLVQDGVWKGERIVSSEWIAEATTAHTPAGDYGYYFWLYPGGVFRAEGHGGQIIHVAPSQDLAVIMTCDPYSASAVLSPGLYGLIDEVMSAVIG